MTDLQLAKSNLAGHTLCLCKDGALLFGEGRGISPMMNFIEKGVDLTGYSAADIVVGKAAAMLFAKCKIKEVFAKTLSEAGRQILEKYKINCEYETLTQKIINRAGTDVCPMEKALADTDDIDEAYLILKETLLQLAAKNN